LSNDDHVEPGMKVLMAEDEEPMRERLRALMAGSAHAQLRCVTQDAVVLMLTTAAWRPDVVILDIFITGVSARSQCPAEHLADELTQPGAPRIGQMKSRN